MLPMNLYRLEGDRAEVTVARTVVRAPSLLPRFTHRSPDDLRALVAQHAAQARLHRALGEIEEAVVAAARGVAWAEAGVHDAQIASLRALMDELVERRELERRLRKERAAGGYHRRQTL